MASFDMTRVLGVFAHPDDETWFAGATFAGFAATGADVRLVTLTAGEAAGADRMDRYAEACAGLGVAGWELPEPGRWRDDGPRIVDGTVAAATVADVFDVVRRVVEAHRPDILFTVGADGVTGHPDHIRVHRAVVEVYETLDDVTCELRFGCVRRVDVHAAADRLRSLAPARSLESAITGVHIRDDDLIETTPSADAIEAKRRALDVYHPDLGSKPLEDLLQVDDPDRPIRDGLLLRAICDVTDDREYFQPTITSPKSTGPNPLGDDPPP